MTQVNEDLYDTHSHLNIVKSHPMKHFIMNWKTHESNISFHNNKQVDDKIPLPQAIWNEFWTRYCERVVTVHW